MTQTYDMSLAGIREQYQSGVEPQQLFAQIRHNAQVYSGHNVFIHLLTEDELAPWLDGLKLINPADVSLWGVPFVVKDNMDIAGLPTTAACEAFSHTPTRTATVIQRLIDQGAVPIGKANLDQFATGLNGTRSPWGACANSFDQSLVSGGSSSGSAVAVALGLASFSLGTDTAGSGRVPACFNNLVGVKPTRGLISTSGVVPACRSLDCVSIFALHSDDANTVLSVAEGYDEQDPYSRVNPHDNKPHTYGCHTSALTFGVLAEADLKFFGDSSYEAAYGKTLEAIKANGIEVREIDYQPFDEVARLLYEGPWVAERYIATSPLIEQEPEAMFPVVRDIIAQGGQPRATDVFRAQYRLTELAKRCHEQLSLVDALMTPTAGRLFSIEEMLAEPVKRNSELGYYMNFVNLLDLAAIAVPTGFTHTGLPFGVTLSAPAFSDRHLLSIANRLQQHCRTPTGASLHPLPALTSTPVSSKYWTELVVCGAHMDGMPLNHQLTERGGQFVEQTQSADAYRLYALASQGIERPALVRTTGSGAHIDVEVWRLPSALLGSFLADIAAPLGLGKVELADGRWVCGFIAEACAAESGTEITSFGGWRPYLESRH